MKRVLVVGATSAIAHAACRHWAASGTRFFLAARDAAKLEAMAADLRVRGAAEVHHAPFEATDYDNHARLVDDAVSRLGGLDVALVAFGTLPSQAGCESDAAAARLAFETNATAVISVLTPLANHFERSRAGTIAVIGSVAGDRGRASNYVYGAAKAAVATFMAGLAHRLHARGVHVLTIKPGFVDTPMTAAFPKGPLWASADAVGRGIVRAVDSRSDVVYLPGFWRAVMWVIRSVPGFVFKKTRL